MSDAIGDQLDIEQLREQVERLVRTGDTKRLKLVRDQLKAAVDRRQAADRSSRWVQDPVAWVSDRLGQSVWSKQRDIMESVRDHRKTAVRSCHSSGKALSLDTPLPTPTGWTTMGDTREGDYLLDEHGRPVKVLAVSPVHERDTFDVVFDDGSVITASDDHQWHVLDLNVRHRTRQLRRGRGAPPICDWRDEWELAETRTTRELLDGLHTTTGTRGGQLRWAVPTTRPIVGEAHDLPIPPYTFGAWLGDGDSAEPRITVAHEDAPSLLKQVTIEGITVRETPSRRRETTTAYTLIDGVRSAMRRAGVLNNKHIPHAYLRAEQETRLALLAGIMDTDGFVNRGGGSVGLDITSAPIADAVAELAASFGWKVYRRTKRATYYGKDCGTVYRISFRPDRQVFRLPRKAQKLRLDTTAHRSRHTTRSIVDVRPVPRVPVKCVAVDSPTSLYLAGRNFVPTHNSHVASLIVSWWLDSHPPGEAFVVTTAPTTAQVRAILWRYIRRLHKANKLPGRVNQVEWLIDEELVAFGRKPADTDESAFVGIHAPYVLCVIDEACGVPDQLWIGAEAITTGPYCRILAIGNPDNSATTFYKVHQPGSGWNSISISAFDTPNFTGEAVSKEVAVSLVSKEWAQEKKADWGEDNALYLSKVLGEFSVDSADTVVRSSDVALCRIDPETTYSPADLSPVELGVDVGGGSDETVIRERRGIKAGREWRIRTDRPEKIAPLVVKAIRETGATSVKVDSIGVGFGVIGELRNCASRGEHNARIIGVNVSSAPADRKKFVNLRAEMWWTIGRELSASRGWDLSQMENPDTTTAQLLEPRWDVDSKGKIRVEPKEEVIKRLGRSPDNADALLLAFHSGMRPRIRFM
jgi:hypothetical protein